jgi:hypothetical protein
MRKNREFDNILDECLERLLAKGETLEQCLESYPEQADELKPLLQTALTTKKASAIQPRPEFKASARARFRSALQEMDSKRSRPFPGWQPRWAIAVAIVLILLLVGGGSTALAAGNSMPDNPLYPVKLATEQVRLALTFSDIGKAQLSARLADKRVTEIVYLANQDKPGQIESVTRRLDAYLANVAMLATAPEEETSAFLAPAPAAETPVPAAELAPAPSRQGRNVKEFPSQANNQTKLREIVARYAVKHQAALREALETAPESAKPALRRAIVISEAGYGKALKNLD